MLAACGVHLGEDLLGDLDRVVGRRHAGIDRDMQQRLADVVARGAGVGGGAHMHRHLLVVAERRKQRDASPSSARACVQVGPRPDGSPGRLGDQLLERPVEIGRCLSARSTWASPSTERLTAMPWRYLAEACAGSCMFTFSSWKAGREQRTILQPNVSEIFGLVK